MKRKLIVVMLFMVSLLLIGCSPSNEDAQPSDSINESETIIETDSETLVETELETDNSDTEQDSDDDYGTVVENPFENAKLMGIALVKSDISDDSQEAYSEISSDEILDGQIVDTGSYKEVEFDKESLGDIGVVKGNNMDAGIPERSLTAIGSGELFEDIEISTLNIDASILGDSHDGSPLDVYLIFYKENGEIFLNKQYRLNHFNEDYNIVIQNEYEVEKAATDDPMEYLTINLFVEAKE